MKRIAIVSCFWVKNYGSVLQAYATQYKLQQMGFDVKTINYSDTHVGLDKLVFQFKMFELDPCMKSRLRRVLNKRKRGTEISTKIVQRHRALTNFVNKHILLTSKFWDKRKISNIVDEYDAVVVGSDQLWLPYNILVDYYTLNFVPDNIKKVSYATSFGVKEIPKHFIKRYQKFLKRLDYISVRELAGARLVNELIGKNVPVVCDPTLMLTADDWLSIQDKEPFMKGNYIFCYFLGNNPEHREFAIRLKEKTGLKIVALLHLDEYIQTDEGYADYMPYGVDPGDFINIVRNASYVLTDSFHCTIFSILHHKPFFVFNRYKNNGKQSTNSRIDSILSITGLHNRRLSGTEDVNECISADLDFKIADMNIEKLRTETNEYLTKALKHG